jgi:hypothetical protein
MFERRNLRNLLVVVMVITTVLPSRNSPAAEKAASKMETRVAGILFDFDRKAGWLTVKADGEDQPVMYWIDPADRNLERMLKTVFNAARVQLSYRTDGEKRQLVAIKRQILKASGTVTGVVVNVHNGFWIELKPKNGLVDAYAPGANYNDSAFMARLRALKPGDSVTIRYTTDFERHRIEALRKNAGASERPSRPGPAGAADRD